MFDLYMNGNVTPIYRKCTLFTVKMLAMDISDKERIVVDILSRETGEVLATYDHGFLIYEVA